MDRFDLEIISCKNCKRLIEYANDVKENGRKVGYGVDEYWCKPVPSFGPLDAELLIVGLAPGTHGAGRTGRPFTGDYAGELLYETLYEFSMCNKSKSMNNKDGLELKNVRISNAVRCAPPKNKPTTEEVTNCSDFLVEEICMMNNLKTILALGGLAHRAVLRTMSLKQSRYPFSHGAEHELDEKNWKLVDSYHPSRYNLNTGRLNAKMFKDVFKVLKR